MEHGDKQSTDGQQAFFHEETIDILAPTAKSLIAIGVATALNCHSCLNHLVPTAVQNGILEEEIKATISLVAQVRRHATAATDKLVTDLLLPQGAAREPGKGCCQDVRR